MAEARTAVRKRSFGPSARAWALFAFVLLGALLFAGRSQAAVEFPPPPQVWSDQADYAPGDTVTLSGANWAPGETVHLVVNDDAGQTWRYENDVSASAEGSFSDQFELPDWFVAVYTVTAAGASSGTATWAFTDSRNVDAATLDGGASVTVVSGATISAAVTVTTDAGGGNQNWRSTGLRISTTAPGSVTCVNHPNHDGAGTYSETFNVAAPALTGTYNAYFIAYSNDTCSQQPSGLKTLTNAVVVTPPSVLRIDRAGSSPTNAASVPWDVVFDRAVTGVGAADFALAEGGGLSGSSIGSVSGTGASYTVTAATGTGDGTLGLDLVDDDSIADGAGNKLGGTGAGNGSFTGQAYTVDKAAPTVSGTAVTLPEDAAYSAGTWTNRSVRVTFTCSDTGGSGLTAGSGDETQDFTAETSGTTATFSGTCADNAGNTAGGASFGPIMIDKTAPAITATLAPAPNSAGWNNTDVTVSYSCADALSGLDPAYGNDGAGCWLDDIATSEGLTQFTNRAVFDRAGNVASVSPEVRIDKAPPTITATLTPAPNANGWNNTDVTADFDCFDGLSGLDPAYGNDGAGCWNDELVTAEGLTTFVNRTAFDKAGNFSSISPSVRIDKQDPSSSATSPAYSNTGSFAVSYSAADSGASGLDEVELWAKAPGESSYSQVASDSTPASSGSFAYTAAAGDGAYAFYTRALDRAGNYEDAPAAADTTTFVDTVAPTSTDDAPAGWQNVDVTVHLSATDPGAGDSPPTGSGVATVKYSVDGGPLQTVSGASADVTVPAPADHSNDGVHTVSYYATDNAGNVEAANSATVRIDTRKPSSQAVSPAYNNVSTISVSFTASDPGAAAAGLAKVELWAKGPTDAVFTKHDETTTSLASGSFSYSVTQGDGLYRFYTIAVDDAGNRESAPATPDASLQVTTTLQDTVAPASSASSPDYATGGPITVEYSASDGGSGLDELELWAKEPGASAFSLAATDSTPSSAGSFSYTPAAGDGTYEFHTRARDEATNYEDAPASADDATVVDTVAPAMFCDAADGAWHDDNVSIGCTASDDGSGLADASDASFTLTTSVPAGAETDDAATNSRTVADKAGNEATAGPVSGNKVDRKGPSVTLTCPSSPVLKGSSATASWSASDGGSGLVGPSSGTISLDTSWVGSQTASVPAGFKTDDVGNGSDAASCNYSVVFNWRGFFQPIDNLPTLNKAKAGSTIPVKFSLTGNQGLSIFMSGYPSSRDVACGSTANADLIEQTITAGGSSLQYDATADQYVYAWKTQSGWSGTCRTLTVKLVDGTVHQANFFFVR